MAGLARPAPAQETRVETAPAEELLEVEDALGSATREKQEADARARAASRDVAQLQRDLVDAAARAQTLEQAVIDAEAHLEGLEAARQVMEAMLAERRAQLVESLAALQRLDLEPPPALLVKPEDALSAARSALLLGTLVPELRTLAEELGSRLKALETLKTNIERERARLTADQIALDTERRRIDELLVQRRAQAAVSLADAARADRRYAALAEKAENLRDLLGGLESAVPTQEAALTGRESAEKRPFSEARGHLKQPVVGRIVQRYGTDDGAGGIAHGVTLATREDADVVSPYDAEIVFAGPFRSYGNVLIITPGEDYLIVLAGLSEIYGTPGQRLLAGEPVGRMGPQPVSGTASGTGAGDQPVLYIELRKNGAPVDPAPWISFANRPA